MKKFFAALTVALAVVTSANFCAANSYDDDPNYFYVNAISQGILYLYLPSVTVQEYNPPHYQIIGKFVHVGGAAAGGEINTYYRAKRYNWDTKSTFSLESNGTWRKDEFNYEDTFCISGRKVADALFRAAYGVDFYGY